jgi:hypothetical protein
MLKALGAEQCDLNGKTVWGLFDNIPEQIDFGEREIWGEAITLTVSEDDATAVYRGMPITVNSKSYTVAEEPLNENGMKIIPLAKAF